LAALALSFPAAASGIPTATSLEVVPGLIVTQHSGDGKANQYFLRAFNLDHGTDFATSVDGIPVNMPTHAHGQGYADINFLIPELVEEVRYRKGPYFADEGNFSAAGAADIVYRRAVDAPQASLTVGENDYYRALPVGLDYSQADGPWGVRHALADVAMGADARLAGGVSCGGQYAQLRRRWAERIAGGGQSRAAVFRGAHQDPLAGRPGARVHGDDGATLGSPLRLVGGSSRHGRDRVGLWRAGRRAHSRRHRSLAVRAGAVVPRRIQPTTGLDNYGVHGRAQRDAGAQRARIAHPAFNLGVEAGQLLVVAMAFVVRRLLARHPVFVASRTPALYAIGSVAAYGSIGRVLAILS